ncbi:MAG: hypothetical protein P8M77_00990 [Porticoccaceae bacterium]|nr:hypothetical protein [Porticoccaceae bacterium]
MNLFSFTCLVTVATGTLFGASIGLFAYGADIWTSTGIGCGIGFCVAISEIFPVFD